MKYLIVGCGLSGVVIAERIANILKKKVTIIEKREHIGGNCYDYIDPETGILMNKYGAHLFHTNSEIVWNYINSFDKWIRWEHKVLTYIDNKFVSIPVNITTINELCNENLQNENDVNEWLNKNQIKYDNITNSEEMAKSRIGKQLYEKLIKNYTFKQWNKYPNELDKSVLERIPIRSNFDTRYFNDRYQALPHKGYTHFFKKILDNQNITVKLNTDYFDYIKNNNYDIIIFTGPIDSYFPNLDKLEYRSIDFNIQIIKNMNYYQPNSVVNYPSLNVPYTRIVEYKHFLNQQSKDTIIVTEKTNDIGEPYYPVPNKRNLELYEKYKQLAKQEESKNVYFIGRLANYKYFNMDEAILNSLNFFKLKFHNTIHHNNLYMEMYSE
jgi:UDP-galactopyranose mutase